MQNLFTQKTAMTLRLNCAELHR